MLFLASPEHESVGVWLVWSAVILLGALAGSVQGDKTNYRTMRVMSLVIASMLTVSASQHVFAAGLGHTVSEPVDGVLVFLQDEPGIGNSVAVITGQDIFVVDATISPAGAEAIIQDIRRQTDKPVRYLLNTHWHDDHIWGNQAYVSAYPGAEIIAHANTREDMLGLAVPTLGEQLERLQTRIAERQQTLDRGTDNGNPLTDEQRRKLEGRLAAFRTFYKDAQTIRPEPPTLTFEKELTLHRGNEEIRLLYLGRGNTRGDVAAYLPQRRVLITGDLLTYPIPAAAGSHIPEWILTLKQLASFEFDFIIPGHGPVLNDRKYLDRVIILLEAVVTKVQESVANEFSLEQTLEYVRLNEHRTTFVHDDPALDQAFDRFFLHPAIESTYQELKTNRQD